MSTLRGMKHLWACLLALGVALAQPSTSNPDNFYNLCLRLFDAGNPELALNDCNNALTLNPNHIPSLKLSARIHLTLNRPLEAQQSLTRLVELQVNDGDVQLLRAWAALLEGRPNETLTLLSQQVSSEALLLRGRALQAVGRLDEALALYLRIPGVREARLEAAKIYRLNGQIQEGISILGNSSQEQLLKAELLWSAGNLDQASKMLEGLLPRLSAFDGSYAQALAALAMIYYGQGDFTKGGLVLRQLSNRVNLWGVLLSHIWVYAAVLIIFLATLLYAESRIEPMRTVELSHEPSYGPGTIYLWLVAAIGLGSVMASGIGYWLYGNWLALFTPAQAPLIVSLMFMFTGVIALAMAYVRLKGDMRKYFGDPRSWADGLWLALVLMLMLWAYVWLRQNFDLSIGMLAPILPTFVGLALLEPLRNLTRKAITERYGDPFLPLSLLLISLVPPGPTLYLLAAGFVLTLYYRRTGGVIAGMVAWLLMGLILTLASNTPLIRAWL